MKKIIDRHKGETALIMACGPSLNAIPEPFFDEYASFGLNRSYIKYEPEYFVGVEPGLFVGCLREIKELDCEKFIPSQYCEVVRNSYPLRSIQAEVFSETPPDVYEGWTVTYVALQIAYWMGFETVLIAGLDHRYKEQGAESDHFNPGYNTSEERYYPPRFDKVEAAYRMADEHYKAHNRRIVNISPGTACDIFEQQDWRKYA